MQNDFAATISIALSLNAENHASGELPGEGTVVFLTPDLVFLTPPCFFDP